MKNIDKTVLKETRYMACFSLFLSLLMQAVFLVLQKWDYTVLLGNLLSFAAAVGNFFLMGLTVQSAVLKEEKQAKNLMKLSQTGRTSLLFLAAALGVLLPCFNTVSSLLPLFFPRIAAALRPVFLKREEEENSPQGETEGVKHHEE